MAIYELWDTDSFNLIDEFSTEAAALAAARELIALNPLAYPEALALACGDQQETVWLASGLELAKRIASAPSLPIQPITA